MMIQGLAHLCTTLDKKRPLVQLSRTEGVLHPANMYVVGPLIYTPLSYPGRILTTLTKMQKSMVDISMDMQFYVVTKHMCWNQPRKFQNIVVHQGSMHIQ